MTRRSCGPGSGKGSSGGGTRGSRRMEAQLVRSTRSSATEALCRAGAKSRKGADMTTAKRFACAIAFMLPAMLVLPKAADEPNTREWPALSWGRGAQVDVAAFNARIPEDASWAGDPILVARLLIDDSWEDLIERWRPGSERGEQPFWSRRSRIDLESENGERPVSVRVTILRRGFLDDSVRGDANRVDLRIQRDGSWRPVAAERFYLCSRLGPAYWTAELCP